MQYTEPHNLIVMKVILRRIYVLLVEEAAKATREKGKYKSQRV